jgi:hypothetical protein
VRLAAPVQLARRAGAGPLAQRGVHPLLHETLPEAHQGVRVQADVLGGHRIRLAGIGAQQRAGTFVPPHPSRAPAG